MSRRKKLFVDGQVLQTAARDRGMGRYCVCLIKALIERNDYDIIMLLTKNLNIDVKHEIESLLGSVEFRELDLWTADKHKLEDASAHNELLLGELMESEAAPDDIFFIPSLFQEPLVSVFPKADVNIRKTLLFHDLIPYLYHQRYQPVMLWENYLKRFKFLFEADLIFTNSQTVADDLSIYLGVPRNKLCRIDGAAIHTDSDIERPEHIDASKPFILCNTSDDPRKNNLRAVLAFEQFRKVTGRDYNLVMTSYFDKRQQEQLQKLSGNLQFTGSIPEKQINWLYDNCNFVLFVSESEGLGLPALEAVDAGKKAVCSSISVLREISNEAFFFCDYESSYSIMQAMIEADDPNTKVNRSAYAAIQKYYSWPKTAERMIQGLNELKPTRAKAASKPKIAIMMATPSGLSGVGLTGTILHPTLSEYFDIDYYLEHGLGSASIRPNYLQYVTSCYPASSFSAERYAQYDAVFYHIGNGDYHLHSITSAFNLPGYLIVHDTTIVEAFRVMKEAGMMSEDRVRLEARLDELRGTKLSSHYTSLVNRQLGILVHSNYAYKAMNEILDTKVSVVKANLPTMTPEGENPRDYNEGKITIGLAGAIADVKGLDVIEAIAEDPNFADCEIKLFGFNHSSPGRLEKLQSYSNVSVATNVSDFDFQTSFSKLDIFVNYRIAYKGETSNTTLEAMRQGVVAVVRDVGWYGELKDDVVVKVKTPEEVIAALRKLVQDRKRLKKIGTKAREFVRSGFSGEQYAQSMLQLLESSKDINNPNSQQAESIKEGLR